MPNALKKILLVDDSPFMLAMLANAFVVVERIFRQPVGDLRGAVGTKGQLIEEVGLLWFEQSAFCLQHAAAYQHIKVEVFCDPVVSADVA